MNRTAGRRYLPVVMMASSLAIASACASTPPAQNAAGGLQAASPGVSGSPSAAPAAAAPSKVGALTLSIGTSDVTVGKTDVHFASSVTDASWSADGSRLAYVDGNGNIATANADGSDVQVLTKTDKAVTRAQPVWAVRQTEIAFSERGKDGVWHLMSVSSGTAVLGSATWPEGDAGPQLPGGDHAPSSAYVPQVGADNGVDLVAFEHDAKSGAQVWIMDFNQRDPEGLFLIAGAHPALSPDGKTLAYVGKDGQLYVTPVAKASAKSSTQISFGVHGITHPAWSADGTRIAYATATDVESISAKLAPGVKTNVPTVESAKVGVPSYVPMTTDSVVRLTGADPIADSIAVSQQLWNITNAKTNEPTQGNLTMPSTVTLVNSSDASTLAHDPQLAFSGGPILFTDGKTLDPRTAAEVKRALAKKSFPEQTLTVQIYGGTGEMSAGIETAAKALGYPVVRVTEKATSRQSVMYIVASDTDQAVLSNIRQLSENFVVILVHGSSMTPVQRAGIQEVDGQPAAVYVAGATARAAVQASWSGKPPMQITDLPTTDLSTESVAFAQRYHSQVALVAAGDWQGIVLANLAGTPVIVVDKGGNLSPAALKWLKENAPTIDAVYAFGNSSSVTDATLAAAATAVSGQAGYALVAS